MASGTNFGEMHFTLKNGVNMPAVGLGTLGMRNYHMLYKTIDHALESGYRLFDTAATYGNEKLLKKVFQQLLPKHGLVREDIFITTKIAPITHDVKFALRSFERSLENLDTDYIDLYLIHYPSTPYSDPKSARNARLRAETWLAITKLYDQSKIKAVGVANFDIRHLMQLTEVMAVGPMVNQLEWHPYYYKPEMLQYCNENNIRIQAYNSFGTVSKNHTALFQDPVVKDLAQRYEVSPAQVLLVWSLQKGVAVIPKSGNAEHLQENKYLNFRISEDDMLQLDAISATNRKYSWDPTMIA